jgi:hypothetical protein
VAICLSSLGAPQTPGPQRSRGPLDLPLRHHRSYPHEVASLLRRRLRLLGQRTLDGVARVEEAKTGGAGGRGDAPGIPGSRERAVAGVHAGRGAPESVLPRRRAQGHGLWTSPSPDRSFIRAVTLLIGGPHRARAAILGVVLGRVGAGLRGWWRELRSCFDLFGVVDC